MNVKKINGILIAIEAQNIRYDTLQSMGLGPNGNTQWSIEANLVVNIGKIPDFLTSVPNTDIDQTLMDQIDFSSCSPNYFRNYQFIFSGPSAVDMDSLQAEEELSYVETANRYVLSFAGSNTGMIINSIETDFEDSENFTTNVDSWVEFVENNY